MNEEIEIRSAGDQTTFSESSSSRRLVPMSIGTSVVYIEQVGEAITVEPDDSIYPVASPRDAFEGAMEALKECVRALGERFEQLTEKVKPQEVTVEFSLTFDVKGKVSPIPILVTGETETQTGLKVTAVWRHSDGNKP